MKNNTAGTIVIAMFAALVVLIVGLGVSYGAISYTLRNGDITQDTFAGCLLISIGTLPALLSIAGVDSIVKAAAKKIENSMTNTKED